MDVNEAFSIMDPRPMFHWESFEQALARNVRFRCWFARGKSFHHVSIYFTLLFHGNPKGPRVETIKHLPHPLLWWEHLWNCSILRSIELEEQCLRCQQVGLYWLQWALSTRSQNHESNHQFGIRMSPFLDPSLGHIFRPLHIGPPRNKWYAVGVQARKPNLRPQSRAGSCGSFGLIPLLVPTFHHNPLGEMGPEVVIPLFYFTWKYLILPL